MRVCGTVQKQSRSRARSRHCPDLPSLTPMCATRKPRLRWNSRPNIACTKWLPLAPECWRLRWVPESVGARIGSHCIRPRRNPMYNHCYNTVLSIVSAPVYKKAYFILQWLVIIHTGSSTVNDHYSYWFLNSDWSLFILEHMESLLLGTTITTMLELCNRSQWWFVS